LVAMRGCSLHPHFSRPPPRRRRDSSRRQRPHSCQEIGLAQHPLPEQCLCDATTLVFSQTLGQALAVIRLTCERGVAILPVVVVVGQQGVGCCSLPGGLTLWLRCI